MCPTVCPYLCPIEYEGTEVQKGINVLARMSHLRRLSQDLLSRTSGPDSDVWVRTLTRNPRIPHVIFRFPPKNHWLSIFFISKIFSHLLTSWVKGKPIWCENIRRFSSWGFLLKSWPGCLRRDILARTSWPGLLWPIVILPLRKRVWAWIWVCWCKRLFNLTHYWCQPYSYPSEEPVTGSMIDMPWLS